MQTDWNNKKMSESIHSVIEFFFNEVELKQWWIKDEVFDQMLQNRFSQLHHQATQCELATWRHSALGRLAEIIILDQFSRNIHRNTPQAFASDPLALCLAQHAVSLNCQNELEDQHRPFLYMPFMHCESKVVHVTAERLFSEPQVSSNKDFELRHKAIIDRFGRYPHRNQILGRESTAQEIKFLQQPGSSF
jgi:uncharacterized protein (DUF924 family)